MSLIIGQNSTHGSSNIKGLKKKSSPKFFPKIFNLTPVMKNESDKYKLRDILQNSSQDSSENVIIKEKD